MDDYGGVDGEIIQPAENVGVDLLQAFDGPRHQGVQQTTVKERIRLLLALPVDGQGAVERMNTSYFSASLWTASMAPGIGSIKA